ncbi:hypothetical protein PILCRDRAFT_826363 [Piloderma croceum F 1598]|uniref:Major facilitator superfamily (MFS) profile domain-containing protein n=1 Tax=Piloderma croceum (strain F 1598) TaxID=765440 RepID=A0A0C3BG84_PILCF|nr:hypothetical protein PILCRDRAFT_826363 [Piloderma croceum F 1598]
MEEHPLATSTLGEQSVTHAVLIDAPKRDWRFWFSFLAICISVFIAALELTGVSTALPIIVDDLKGTEFLWAGSAYALAATAFIPFNGGLAELFGRRLVLLWSLLIFAGGSALCGAANNLNLLIAGRAVQGMGGGGLASVTQIILSDLVPLHDRGKFNGLIAMSYGIASGMGPVIGGSLAQQGQWRWLFYLNIPICGFAAVLVFAFLRLRVPPGTLWEKTKRIDWLGNLFFVACTTSCVIGLTWGGIQFSWGAAQVLVPLLFGLIGLGCFIVYESKVPTNPIISSTLMSTRTGFSGYLQTFFTSIILLAVIYYGPVYFQACKGASPIASGVDVFGTAFSIVPAGILSGLSVAKTKRYRPQLWLAWMLIIIEMGLLSTINADSSRASAIGFQVIGGCGMGILVTSAYFPVLAPLPVSENARAIAFFMFCRNFAQIWGVTIGGTILQNMLRLRLPDEFLASFPQGTAIAYKVIPLLSSLEEPLKTEVRDAFASSLRVVWQVMIGVGALGLIASLAMEHLPLHTSIDEKWGIADSEHKQNNTL